MESIAGGGRGGAGGGSGGGGVGAGDWQRLSLIMLDGHGRNRFHCKGLMTSIWIHHGST